MNLFPSATETKSNFQSNWFRSYKPETKTASQKEAAYCVCLYIY